MSCARTLACAAAVSGAARPRLSLPRQGRHRDHVRPNLLQPKESQSQSALCRQIVGIKQTQDRLWLISFMDYDLRYFDDETCRLEPLANPFEPKVLPMSS